MLGLIAKTMKKALLGVGVLFAVAGPAHSATFVGDWDPAYGNPFPSLGWQGSVTFYIPDACLLLSGNINNQNACANNTMSLLTGQVDFYNLSNPSVILGSLFYTGTPAQQFITVDVSGGTVVGLHADFNQWVHTSTNNVGIAGEPYTTFDLSFLGNCARLQYNSTSPGQTNGAGGFSDPCGTDSGPLLHFSLLGASIVPEPGSLALLLPAIGALAAIRRRKSAAVA